MSKNNNIWNSDTLKKIRYHVYNFRGERFHVIGAIKPKTATAKQRLSIIVCYIKGHCFCEEIMIDKNNTRNNCRCGRFMLFEWSNLGGYKSAMSTIAHLKRKRKWNES